MLKINSYVKELHSCVFSLLLNLIQIQTLHKILFLFISLYLSVYMFSVPVDLTDFLTWKNYLLSLYVVKVIFSFSFYVFLLSPRLLLSHPTMFLSLSLSLSFTVRRIFWTFLEAEKIQCFSQLVLDCNRHNFNCKSKKVSLPSSFRSSKALLSEDFLGTKRDVVLILNNMVAH